GEHPCHGGAIYASFFFQAEDGIRADLVTGVQTCALPISIGDDRLQRQSQGRVVPESFTHGSSAQRVRWFKRGIETGDPGQCDTRSEERRVGKAWRAGASVD